MSETPISVGLSMPCAWCASPVQQLGVGRRREYCRRSCRQRAYEARREAERTANAVTAALVSSRDNRVRPAMPPVGPPRTEYERATRLLPKAVAELMPLWE